MMPVRHSQAHSRGTRDCVGRSCLQRFCPTVARGCQQQQGYVLRSRVATHATPDVSARATAVQAPAADAPAAEKAEKAPPATAEAPAAVASNKIAIEDTILFQAFGWDSCHKGNWYGTIKNLIPEYQAAGFTHIWLPPPSNSPVAPQGYMPGQLYNLSSKYGNEEQLTELNSALKAAGILPVADIVINHRTASEQSKDGTWNKFGDDQDHEGRKIDWDKWAITGNDPHFKGTGNPDTGEDYGPAPDLDHMNPDLREGLKHWLQYLQNNVGFAGWRLDYVKGFAPSYVEEYIKASVGEGTFNVGEYWTDLKWNGEDLDTNQDAARQRLCDWIDGCKQTSSAFDFPTKGILQEAVKKCQYYRLRDHSGKPAGLMGWWPKMAVTFVDNHDTGSSQAHWPFPSDRVGAGYAYILTHPGVPSVFWEHYFDWGDEMKNTIKTLIDVRKRNGIRADSKLEIQCAEGDMYVAKVNDKVVVKLGPRLEMGDLKPKKEEGWVKAIFGPDFCVWEKSSQ